jgi:hypothetical protein
MKKSITAVLVLFSIVCHAQQKVPVAPGPKPGPLTLSLTQKDSLICKAWKLTIVDVFGTVNKPGEKQKNDGITLILDGTAFLTMDGVARTGKWSFDKPKANLMIDVDGGKEKFRFRIITLTKDQLLYEYQDPELIKTKYTFEPLKK